MVSKVLPDSDVFWKYEILVAKNGSEPRVILASGTSDGHGRLALALADAVRDGTYYLAQGYKVQVAVHCACAKCQGEGRIPCGRTRTGRTITRACPTCHGGRWAPPAALPTFAVVVHENISVLDTPRAAV